MHLALRIYAHKYIIDKLLVQWWARWLIGKIHRCRKCWVAICEERNFRLRDRPLLFRSINTKKRFSLFFFIILLNASKINSDFVVVVFVSLVSDDVVQDTHEANTLSFLFSSDKKLRNRGILFIIIYSKYNREMWKFREDGINEAPGPRAHEMYI